MSIDRLSASRVLPSPTGYEIDRLRARGTDHLLVEWPLPAPDSDDVIGPEDVRTLTAALLAVGHVAFRWDEDDRPADATFFPEPNRSVARRLADRLMPTDARASFGVLTTAVEAVAERIFTWPGWSVAMQAVLVHEPGADLAPIVGALQNGLDWRARALPPGCHLLFGAGHDGGVAVASGSSQAIDRFVRVIVRAADH